MSQSKKKSFLEACVNTLIGYLTTLLFSPLIYSMCGVKIGNGQMGLVVFCFTILSVVRSYVIRRWFNKGDKKHPDHICVPEVLEYKNRPFTGKVLFINKCFCGKVISQKEIK